MSNIILYLCFYLVLINFKIQDMKKFAHIFSAFIIICGMSVPGNTFATKHTVLTGNYFFNPAHISNVTVGDTILWVWQAGSHTTTSSTIPAGAASWDELLNSSHTTYEYKVTEPGSYNYVCTPHAGMGMVGSFTAAAASPTLSVTPSNQNVSANAGSTSFNVISNSTWTAGSDLPWCTVTVSGSGNGTIQANYTENTTFDPRIATITISVTGLAPIAVTLTQGASAVGIPDRQAGSLLIYPNPTSGNFTLVLPGDLPEESSVKVYDMDGRVVYEKLLAGKIEYPINLSEAHAGTYFIRLHNGINNLVQRLVITP